MNEQQPNSQPMWTAYGLILMVKVIPSVMMMRLRRFGEIECKFDLPKPSVSALGFEISAEIRPMRVTKFCAIVVSHSMTVGRPLNCADTIISLRTVVQHRRSVWACAKVLVPHLTHVNWDVRLTLRLSFSDAGHLAY